MLLWLFCCAKGKDERALWARRPAKEVRARKSRSLQLRSKLFKLGRMVMVQRREAEKIAFEPQRPTASQLLEERRCERSTDAKFSSGGAVSMCFCEPTSVTFVECDEVQD